MVLRVLPLVGLLVAALFAGCMTADNPQLDPENGAPPDTSSKGSGLGSIEGRVLEGSSLDVVEAARVALAQAGTIKADTRTDAEGGFRFVDLEPGEYDMRFTADCCREQISRLFLESGETLRHDVLLSRYSMDDLREPYVVEHEWSGHIACGFSIGGAFRYALCSLLDPNDDFMLRLNVPEGIETLSVGISWDSAGGVSGDQLELDITSSGHEYTYANLMGTSPMTVNIGNNDITEEPWSWDQIDGSRGLTFRVFSGGTGVTYQQSFTIHYHLHMWEEAPDGYNPLPDS